MHVYHQLMYGMGLSTRTQRTHGGTTSILLGSNNDLLEHLPPAGLFDCVYVQIARDEGPSQSVTWAAGIRELAGNALLANQAVTQVNWCNVATPCGYSLSRLSRYLRSEFVSDSRYSSDEYGPTGIFFKFLPQAEHMYINGTAICTGIVSPYRP